MSAISEEKRKYFLSTEGVTEAALAESERLTIQHHYIKAVLGGHVVHPSLITKLSTFEKILDVGAANGIWLEELRNNPISSISPSALTHAVDLSDPTLPLPDSISAFMTHDINQPFPPQGYTSKKLKSQKEQNQIGVHGSYDFVHSRLLVLGIEKDQWVNVIKNMAQVLKPGGTLQLTEVIGITCQPQDSFFTGLHPVLVKVNHILGKASDQFNKDFAIGRHLRAHFVEAGLKNVRVVSNVFPVGKIAETMFGFEKKNNGAEHQIGALLWVKAPFLSTGGSSEIQVTTEKQFDDFIAELRRFLEEVGYYTTFVQAVGEK